MVCSPEQSRLNGSKSRGAVTERGKAIASRNATKHGLLAEKPPLLITEDLQTFQGMLHNLLDEYEPVGAIEWHLVQTIAMCIQRQHRLWSAEAALGNAQVLPPVDPPSTDQKYPMERTEQHNGHWSQFHPTNLEKEKRLLQWYCDRHPLTDYPTGQRSKYFSDMWREWVEVNVTDLKRLDNEYPKDDIPRKPDETLSIVNPKKYGSQVYNWLKDLKQEEHPYAVAWFYSFSLEKVDPPQSKGSWEYYQSKHCEVLEAFYKRVERINQIEYEREQEQQRYQQDLNLYREQTTSPISQQVLLLSRYESHIAKQMREAIAQLQSLQEQREIKGLMGSFG